MKNESEKKTINVPLNVWLNEKNGHIHMNVNGVLTSVNNDPKSKRGNPSLFSILEKELIKAGKIREESEVE
ncbi:hypothetical protein [Jeotgalibacillus haloalkalitolerans]|uniref:Uncharacterized protein n=1 Tax=Jeotgalibacillus haloalkalitolerans TaxID=3104292 RepID=A0ABU5KNC9_9BACL|nr:hypothetical protein [Jeotgalibacillus sp. HH7-29]MDZ5712675.1 hypothetical protein [Jeotgalibacillus sp. HH7-29]